MSLKPIKWGNLSCRKNYDTIRRCTEYQCETPVGSHAEIISLLDGGWPICPECGDEMSPLDEDKNIDHTSDHRCMACRIWCDCDNTNSCQYCSQCWDQMKDDDEND
jgi:hypothetical protein